MQVGINHFYTQSQTYYFSTSRHDIHPFPSEIELNSAITLRQPTQKKDNKNYFGTKKKQRVKFNISHVLPKSFKL